MTSKLSKTIAFATSAQDSHNAFKIKNILRWLKSGHEVRVQIDGKADRQKAIEDLMKQIERDTKRAAEMNQKIIKPNSVRFCLKPTKGAESITLDESIEAPKVDDISEITANKDIFSKEFETELEQSIESDMKHSKKK